MDAGESMKELGEVKDALDMEVKQNFIDPLQNLHDKDLKEIQVSKSPASAHSMPLVENDGNRDGSCGVVHTSSWSCMSAASSEEDGGPPAGLRLQEEASGESPGR